jgi:ATP-dependent NAD(P)H-hydrate dehydratase
MYMLKSQALSVFLAILFLGMNKTLTSTVRTIRWADVAHIGRTIIPPLVSSSYKGQHGRIAVIGGSPDYTGAPYYAAQSALKFGADLSFVFCAAEATTPIKSYSPEIMVTPFYDNSKLLEVRHSQPSLFDKTVDSCAAKVIDAFPRIHTLVIGPGLGRSENVSPIVEKVIQSAIAHDIPMVIDADGLWVVTNNLELIRGYTNCVLTPNAPEFDRLRRAILTSVNAAIEALVKTNPSSDNDKVQLDVLALQLGSDEDVVRIYAMSRWLRGVTIVRKGAQDLISQVGRH